jgi:hypothetical protein
MPPLNQLQMLPDRYQFFRKPFYALRPFLYITVAMRHTYGLYLVIGNGRLMEKSFFL